MPVPLLPFEEPAAVWANHPFPSSFSQDGFVLYHGTSSTQEHGIEARGLLPGESRFRKEELQALVSLFESVGWVGPLRSYGVLSLYSVGHDFAHLRGKPTYLAESAKRALNYASVEFAGGEVARAVRYAFEDLRAYLLDPTIRENQLGKDLQTRLRLRTLGALEPPPLPDYNSGALRASLANLAEVERAAASALEEYAHGVVYAIRIQPEDHADLEWHRSMGIKCHRPLGPERLLAKIRVPRTYVHDPTLKSIDRADLPVWTGVLAALRESR